MGSPAPLIRPARPADLPAVAALQRAAILALAADAYGPEAAAAWARDTIAHAPTLLDGGTFFVAERPAGGGPVGVGGWSSREDEPGGAWVRAFFVHPDEARRGIGRRLLAAVEASARAAGRTAFAVRASINAVGFYQAMGYSEVERRRLRPRDGFDLPYALMVKPRAPADADAPAEPRPRQRRCAR